MLSYVLYHLEVEGNAMLCVDVLQDVNRSRKREVELFCLID